MKFLCPQCLGVADIEPRDPAYEIVAVYCLHRSKRLDGGSEPVRMAPAPDPVTTTPEAAATGA